MASFGLFGCVLLLVCLQEIIVQVQGNPIAQEAENLDIGQCISYSSGLDCSDIWQKNKSSACGRYMIRPNGADTPFPVYCEMTKSGGWTLIQRRNGQDGLSFDRLWDEYVQGFGFPEGEHWLGLKYMSNLTNQMKKTCKLRIELEDFSNNTAYAEYSSICISNKENYKLTLGQYSGTAGDAFEGDANNRQHGMFFSTLDNSHDNCKPRCFIADQAYRSCGEIFSSGWWFNACGAANLNGLYLKDEYTDMLAYIAWPTWRVRESLKSTKMLLNCN
ncbi:angiopoietin-related protein 5-like isoform X2 [Hyperolius riggenbachi]